MLLNFFDHSFSIRRPGEIALAVDDPRTETLKFFYDFRNGGLVSYTIYSQIKSIFCKRSRDACANAATTSCDQCNFFHHLVS